LGVLQASNFIRIAPDFGRKDITEKLLLGTGLPCRSSRMAELIYLNRQKTVGLFQGLTAVAEWLLFPFLAGKWLLPNPLGTRIVTAGSNRSK